MRDDRLIILRCPICNKKIAYIAEVDKSISYLQLFCNRCKKELIYSNGGLAVKNK